MIDLVTPNIHVSPIHFREIDMTTEISSDFLPPLFRGVWCHVRALERHSGWSHLKSFWEVGSSKQLGHLQTLQIWETPIKPSILVPNKIYTTIRTWNTLKHYFGFKNREFSTLIIIHFCVIKNDNTLRKVLHYSIQGLTGVIQD